MKATFEVREARVPTGEGGKREVRPVEYVCIHTGRNGADVVHRPATDADRQHFAHEYRAFRAAMAELPAAPAVEPASPPPPSPEAFEELALDELP